MAKPNESLEHRLVCIDWYVMRATAGGEDVPIPEQYADMEISFKSELSTDYPQGEGENLAKIVYGNGEAVFYRWKRSALWEGVAVTFERTDTGERIDLVYQGNLYMKADVKAESGEEITLTLSQYAEFEEDMPWEVFGPYQDVERKPLWKDTFYYDLDGDGKRERVDCSFDREKGLYTIHTESIQYELADVTNAGKLILIDLDPNDGRVNMLLNVWTADGKQIRELHVENGKLVCGHVVEGYCFLKDSEEADRVVQVPTLAVPTDLFGADGYREVRGEALEPVDDRLHASGIIDAIYFGPGREKNIEDGTLLHLVRALPCEIDGVPGTLEPDVYIFLREWNDALTEIVFMTEDGRWITVHPDAGLMLNGISLYDWFDNAPRG